MTKKKMALYGTLIVLAVILLTVILIVIMKRQNAGVNGRNGAGNRISDTSDTDTEPNSDPEDEFVSENPDIPQGEIQPGDNSADGEAGNSPDSQETDSNDNSETVQVPDNTDDPQHEGTEGIVIDVREIEKSENETEMITYGIDVAKWQGVIDWAKVKEAGVEFAMIRVGYRTQVDGEITEDSYAKYNLQQAQKHGIKLGVYFFSTAISRKEAEEEAKWVAQYIAPYKITYPVVYNCEGFTDPDNRQYGMTKDERTGMAVAFLDFIKGKGYEPMFYAAKNELEGSRDWDTDSLTSKYKIWVAQYPDKIDSADAKSSYSGAHEMWQYTNNGNVPGIKGAVDLNIAYFGYEEEAAAKEDTPVKEVTADPTALIKFKEVKETVTAKEVTNLRDIPGLDNGSKVMETLQYGDTATRTGIGDNGWSRVEYKGKTLYAVTSYLTTDLNYKEASQPTIDNPEAGISFTEVNEKVTAKIVTNLRQVPSTESDDTIAASLENGQIATRTGIGSNGWSRVEYEGQILYAVTNYLEVVTEE